ncbi:hypothetical protein B0H10DRAFT_1951004 [Mycena sp. CBHHK59/15]|nr:hypothetical protein B0H10DRAFT_1951004 [Mycena sp. CBHHK59/15]
MPVTRSTTASPAKRTRSRTVAPFSTPPKFSQSSSPSSRTQTMEAKHRILYPTAVQLGFLGPKAEKLRKIQAAITTVLLPHSPRPPANQLFNTGYLGHSLTPVAKMNTGKKNDKDHGAWFQPCKGFPCSVPQCDHTNRHILVVKAGVLPGVLETEPLRGLLRLRAELLGRAVPAALPLAPFPSPAPQAPLPLLPALPLPAALPTLPAIPQAPLSPLGALPLHPIPRSANIRPHYSPDGHILAFVASPTRADHGSGSDNSSENSGDDGDSVGELGYPQVTLDATLPVVVVAWKDIYSDPIYLTVFTHAHDFPEDHFSRTEVVLEDCRSGLEDAGFPVTNVVDRFLESIGDTVGDWVLHSWLTPIPIYSRNKFIYIKPLRASSPQHASEYLDRYVFLLQLNSNRFSYQPDLTDIILNGSAVSTSRASNLKGVKSLWIPG